jgi:hypothetical protein
MIFHHLIILFALASSTKGQNSENPHGSGPLKPLSTSVAGGAISGMAVADNGEE